jgi:Na+/H+ antiporter NhaA
MKSSIVRSAIATVVGIVVAFVLLWLAQYAGSEISPAEYDVDTGEILIPLGSTIALIVGWFVGTFGGAWLAMRISGGDGPGWIVAGAVIGAAVYSAADFSDTWWIMALGVLVPLIAAWAAKRAAGTAPAAA